MSDLQLPHELIDAGIPVVVCTPRLDYQPGDATDVHHPKGWNTAQADHKALEKYREGIDTLALLSGCGLDVVDPDAKAGATLADLPPFEHFGMHVTPSGGWHLLVPSTGLAKGTLRTVDGRVIGDYCGGTRTGGGRTLVYLPGSSRPKYPGKAYTVAEPWDIAAALEAEPDPLLMGYLTGVCQLTNTGDQAKASATSSQVQAWRARQLHTDSCRYGEATLRRIINEAPTEPGGRHHYFTGAAARVVELVGGECLSVDAVDTLAAAFEKAKPGQASEWGGMLAWAVTNAAPVACEHAAPELGAWNPAPPADDLDGDDNGDQADTAAWWSDLTWLDGGEPPERPTPVYAVRTDGAALFYPGRVNGIYGDPETGKTWVAHVAVVEALLDGYRAGILDADHNTAEATARRLLAMGVPAATLANPDLFRYAAPEDRRDIAAAVMGMAEWGAAVVVLDSLGELLPMLGCESNDNDSVTHGLRLLTADLLRVGAAIITVDHVPKSAEGKGNGYAIGAGAKKRATRGAYLRAHKVAEIVPGKVGRIRLSIEKDSAGSLRAVSGDGKDAGVFILDATDPDALAWRIESGETTTGHKRLTGFMERVSIELEGHAEPVARTAIERAVSGRAEYIRSAVDDLAREGYVQVIEEAHGGRTIRRYASVKPYREADELPAYTGSPVHTSHTRPGYVPDSDPLDPSTRPTPLGGTGTGRVAQGPLETRPPVHPSNGATGDLLGLRRECERHGVAYVTRCPECIEVPA